MYAISKPIDLARRVKSSSIDTKLIIGSKKKMPVKPLLMLSHRSRKKKKQLSAEIRRNCATWTFRERLNRRKEEDFYGVHLFDLFGF